LTREIPAVQDDLSAIQMDPFSTMDLVDRIATLTDRSYATGKARAIDLPVMTVIARSISKKPEFKS